jgi:4a-hydroxytetrahydrobiopterin dehydratase
VKALESNSIEEAVKSLSGWAYDESDRALVRDFAFTDFKEALQFINRVGEVAEELDHHPEIEGVTDKDFELARRVNFLF